MTRFGTDSQGNIALLAALLLPVILGFGGAGLDYMRYTRALADLQEMADSAAIAGAREYFVVADGIPVATAQNVSEKMLAADNLDLEVTTTAFGDAANNKVTVAITGSYTPTLLVSFFENPISVNVDATAEALGGSNVCVIALEETGPRGLSMDTSSNLSGTSCAVYANSTSTSSLVVVDSAKITSGMTCTGGGYSGGMANYDPTPLTDCPPRDDPLASRAAPTPEPCNGEPSYYSDVTKTFEPGTYCNGLMIEGASDVTFNPGIYTIRNKKLFFGDTTKVNGDGVGFYFEDTKATLYVGPDTSITLRAPYTGDMAGLLMYQDRGASENTQFQIASNDAKTLVGTIYLPRAQLYISSNQSVADASAYTAIVARELQLSSSANLVLNTDYGMTKVPVPAGFAGAGENVVLRD